MESFLFASTEMSLCPPRCIARTGSRTKTLKELVLSEPHLGAQSAKSGADCLPAHSSNLKEQGKEWIVLFLKEFQNILLSFNLKMTKNIVNRPE